MALNLAKVVIGYLKERPGEKMTARQIAEWVFTQDGKVREGKPIDKSLVYKLLNNRTYLGELRHKEQWYPADHPPIIDRELWDQAHAILATNGRVRGSCVRSCARPIFWARCCRRRSNSTRPWTKRRSRWP